VCERLTEDPFIDASDIEVSVKDGEVTLAGTVSSRGLQRRAEDLAELASGVAHLQNNLRVDGA
jgi:osmotically-inducible protein OsmY